MSNIDINPDLSTDNQTALRCERPCSSTGEKEVGRRQWEVSPDRVRQISKSYRSIERQDDASETTTVSEQRMSRQERAFQSEVFHADAIATGEGALGHEGRTRTAGGVANGLSYGQATTSEDAAAEHLVQSYEFATHEEGDLTKSEKRHCHHSHHHHDHHHHHVHSSSGRADGGGHAQGRATSLYRPKTSLRLEGPTSLKTGGKAHFSTTTAEDFKIREQTEKVTRRLRPRKFDDPSYDSMQVQVETDVKKRRTEMDAQDRASSDGVHEEVERKIKEEIVHGHQFREDRERAEAQGVFH
ncbi:hypothetical protein HPB51_010200 [Rhipicephalus microplus]|uniref:Uncharacterized protein n=1 Tax=Rhipicephalus microplus TaxID=6941 RepID=A0A9J6F1S9_RHIMP|nr:hypothetical protein HPB51_010200 [Rhipicephalus microplus]